MIAYLWNPLFLTKIKPMQSAFCVMLSSEDLKKWSLTEKVRKSFIIPYSVVCQNLKLKCWDFI